MTAAICPKRALSISTRKTCSGIVLFPARSIVEGHNGSIYAKLMKDNVIEFTAELR